MPAAGFTLEPAAAGQGTGTRLVLAGDVTLDDGPELWRSLRRVLRGLPAPAPAPAPASASSTSGDAATAKAQAVELDLAGVTRLDGGAAALLTAVAAEQAAAGRELRFVGATGEAGRLLALYAAPSKQGGAVYAEPARSTTLGDIGEFAQRAVLTTQAILAFVGDLVVGMVQAVRKPRTVHTGELGVLIERAGTDGLPIVVLINFLVGAILGLQGAIQLHRFGGDQFLANLVGLSVVRELGPLMTAILVTGRSGAAYAAELGTMTVNEEVDALRTLGQDPQRFLVFPRVLTLLLVVPVLTVVGDLIGTLGGLAVAVVYLDQPPVVYLQALQRAVHLGDVGTGLLKSVVFGLAIGLIACQRGLSTRGGADGVGRATTSAVVVVLFALVALDAVFTWLFSLLEW
jgi:phospholipid/cholesterol/gamma-HCH transport system permease protein